MAQLLPRSAAYRNDNCDEPTLLFVAVHDGDHDDRQQSMWLPRPVPLCFKPPNDAAGSRTKTYESRTCRPIHFESVSPQLLDTPFSDP